jgi:hypothetical protein
MNIKRIAGNKKPDEPAIARNPAGSLDEQWAAMNAALDRLGLAKPQSAHPGGRLIVALDLTASRAESLIQARIATAQMFAAIKAVGKVTIKLAYWRGDECKTTAWHDDADKITGAMLSLSCKTGTTQICRVLKQALAEKEKLSGVVLVGDHSEDIPEELLDLAATLGGRSIPLFIFHEVVDHDQRALQARPVFEQMAKLSGGVYSEFRPDSGAILRELLSTVAAFSAAGHEGVKQIAQPVTAPARQLQSSLLMLTAPKGK